MSEQDNEAALYELYDEYCHTSMRRREFLKQAAAIGAAAGLVGCTPKSGATGAPAGAAMLPSYAQCQTVSFTDKRIKARYVTYDSPGGNGKNMRGYLVAPAGPGPFGAVLVVHENRGLNPYVEDVARRAAVSGFLALAPDALWPAGGYPGNDDEGKVMQRALDGDKIRVDMVNSARFLKAHSSSNGKLGVTGFCFGGGISNDLAVELGDALSAAAPFYGRAPDTARVGQIRASLLLHYAEQDPRVNASKEAYESALKASGAAFKSYVYAKTNHGFHNNSTPRFSRSAAELAWQRTMELFKAKLT